MPKLIKVLHIRCDELAEYDYVGVPDDWDIGVIDAKIAEAKKLFLDALKTYNEGKRERPYPDVYGQPDFKKYPDKKVSEVLEEFEFQREENKKWFADNSLKQKTFNGFLIKVGFIELYKMVREGDTFEVDWGHRHGTQIDYGVTETHSEKSVGNTAVPLKKDD